MCRYTLFRSNALYRSSTFSDSRILSDPWILSNSHLRENLFLLKKRFVEIFRRYRMNFKGWPTHSLEHVTYFVCLCGPTCEVVYFTTNQQHPLLGMTQQFVNLNIGSRLELWKLWFWLGSKCRVKCISLLIWVQIVVSYCRDFYINGNNYVLYNLKKTI